MKYANKLMVVPYVPHIDNPTQTQIFTLDQEMEEILYDKGKNVDEKVKLYNQALNKYNKAVENFNTANASADMDYVDTFSSQLADKMYSKIKPDIETLKEPYVTQSIKNEPRQSNKKRTRVKLNKTVNEKFDTTKSEMNDSSFDLADANSVFFDDQLENAQTSKKTVTIASPSKFYKNEEKPYKIFTAENKAQYVVPVGITDTRLKELQELAPNGVDVERAMKYMNTEGERIINEELAQKSGQANIQTRARNTYYIEMNKKFLKEQEGKGLSHAKTWNFKKFF